MYKYLVRPWLFNKDPEEAHDLVLRSLRRLSRVTGALAVLRANYCVDEPRLKQTLFGLHFPNPVGLAAGMDKRAEALLAWEALGFGFAEIGGITWDEQIGNPRPRCFRLVEDESLVNRMGFNNPGAKAMAEHLYSERLPAIPLGINIAKSKSVPTNDMPKVCRDYCSTFEALAPWSDFFVVNVSSPNTPRLRELQAAKTLGKILDALLVTERLAAMSSNGRTKPILVKITGDLANENIEEIAELVRQKAQGIVAVNTTTTRPASLKSPFVSDTGGLSGPPLRERALEVVSLIRKTCPSLPIIGVGGISDANHAWEMIRAGANLVQIFTGLVYQGPSLPRDINRALANTLALHGETMESVHTKTRRN